MKHRKLRIAWSVGWGVVAVLVVVLWVQSYLVYDQLVVRYPNGLFWFIVYSRNGVYILSTFELLLPKVPLQWWFGRGPHGTSLNLPYWFTTMATCAVSVAPWIRYRFSLRTLLIGITVAAALLR